MYFFFIEILSHVNAQEAHTHTKSVNGFKFGTFIGCFPTDGAAILAVKGLKRGRNPGV